jgi:hypothetical protein
LWPFALQHGGAALRLGYDVGLPVSDDYTPPARWSGSIERVVIDTSPQVRRQPMTEVRGALHAD